jgi:putative aldouronate transport system permease protein
MEMREMEMIRGTARPPQWIKGFQKYKVIWLMMLPGLCYFALFHYVPMYGAILAFKDYRILEGIHNSPWVGFHYFERAFNDDYFYQVLSNTIIISLYKLIFGFPVPIMFALFLNEVQQLFFKKMVQTVAYLPHFISWVVMGGIFVSVFSLEGPVNLVMQAIGFEKVVFLADEQYFRAVMIITDIFKSFGWGSIIYFAAISAIDPQLYESAVMDGASKIQRMVYITIPMLVPVIIILLILNMSHVLDAGFDQIFNMYSPSVYEVADIIDTYVYRKGLVEMEYSYSTAIGLFKSVVALILIIIVNTSIRRMGGKEHTLW